MSSIGAALLDCLGTVERPGDFCVGGLREILMPAIDVEGVGRIALPLLPEQAERLVAVAEPAPYGRGEETIVDQEVRRTWQIDARKVQIGGRSWPETLARLAAETAASLGVTEPVAADFYKLLLYDPGSFFVDHRDTEKAPGMFATMVIVLPSSHTGGELLVRHLGREVVLDPRPRDPADVGLIAFYADCVHEVRPVTMGHRLTLIYNLRFAGKRQPVEAPDYRAVEGRAVEILRRWADAEGEPNKLILPLEHAYTPAELSFSALKGADAGVVSVLVKAAAQADCDIHLALVSIEQSGPAEYAGYEDEEFEIVEIADESLTLSEWRRPDGGEVGFGEFPFEEDELCLAGAFEDLTPDEEHFAEATGNEGATFERSYHRAGLVLWPRSRRLAVLDQAGLAATLPHLEELAGRWQASGAGTESAIWREADELSGYMLRSWPRPTWMTDGDARAGRMLDAQVRLGNTARIEQFLAQLPGEGHYAACDNEAIVRAAALLRPPRVTELLVWIVTRNAEFRLGACSDLLRRCVDATPQPVGEPSRIGTALVEVLPGDPAKATKVQDWQRPAPPKPEFVVDLLGASSRIDERLAERAIAHLLAWPKTYDPDDLLVPTALAFAKQPESAAWPAVERLRAAALAHLRRRIALPLEAPRDWARPDPLTCTCADCRALGAFLVDRHHRQWRLKAAQDRRSHVEDSVRRAPCDVDLQTETRGRPYSLVATKNQASYERRATQRRDDLQYVAALGG